jgi:hypothetical protein
MRAAVEAVRTSELAILARLASLREHHPEEHDVFHLAETLAGLARANLERLGAEVPDTVEPAPGGDLLGDLRELHLRYAAASIDWVILAQGAQAARDTELLDAVSASHPDTLRGLNWTTTRLKEAAPQVLTT